MSESTFVGLFSILLGVLFFITPRSILGKANRYQRKIPNFIIPFGNPSPKIHLTKKKRLVFKTIIGFTMIVLGILRLIL